MSHLSGTAMALQWAVHYFKPSPSINLQPENRALEIGLELSANIILPLALELGLKALKEQETSPGEFKRTHDLLDLFQELSPQLQRRLSTRFRQYVSDDRQVCPSTSGLEGFVEKHRTDFVDWRYLEGEATEDLKAAQREFQYALCAVLDEAYPGTSPRPPRPTGIDAA